MFANQRSRFKARGVMVPLVENYVREYTYPKKDEKGKVIGEGKLKSISFNLRTEDNGTIKLDFTGFSNPVRVTTKDGVEKYFELGEKLPSDFEEKYTSFNTLRYTSLVKKGTKIMPEETLFLVGYDFASKLESDYNKFNVKEFMVEIEGEVEYDPYKNKSGGISMPPKYKPTSFKIVTDKDTDTYFIVEAPALIRKKDLNNLPITVTEDTISARIPIFSPLYLRTIKTRVYFPQEIVLSSDYMFGKFLKDDDMEAKKASFYEVLDGLKESTMDSEYIIIKYEACHINKQDNASKEFSIENLSEAEQKKLNAMKPKDKEKLLEIYKKRNKYIAPFIRKDFLDFLYLSDGGTFFEDIENSAVFIYEIPVIFDILKNKASAPSQSTTTSSNTQTSQEDVGLDDIEEEKVVEDKKPEPKKEQQSAEEIIKQALESEEDNNPDEIDDDFPF